MSEIRKTLCPICERESAVEFGIHRETIPVRGVDIEIAAEYQRCTACGEEFADGEQMDRALQAAYAEYRTLFGILSPDDIRSIRTKYGASQKAFGLVLGFGELTINSYESGSLPNEANNNLLKLARHPETFKEIFDANKEKIGPTQRKRIEAALALVAGHGDCPESVAESSPAYGCAEPKASEYTGFVQPDKEKLFRVIAAILLMAGTKLYKTQIIKLVFYSEFAHFREYTVPISGWPFAAIDHGPVPNDYQLLFYEGEKDGFFQSETDSAEIGDLYSVASGVDQVSLFDSFSEDELTTMKTIVTKLGGKRSVELSRISHRERAWTETPHAKLISYELAKDLTAV